MNTMSKDFQLSRAEVLRFAIPSTLFSVLRHGYRAVDQYWIQHVSTEAQAAIGSSTFVLILFAGLFVMISAGAGPLIARATGAGDWALRRRVLGSSFCGVLLITLVTMVVGSVFASQIASLLGLSGETHEECVRYLTTLTLTCFPLVLMPLVDQAFIAMGSARTPMILHGVMLSLNVLLTPFMIHTMGLGIVGAALASNLSYFIGGSIGFAIIWRRAGATRDDVRFDEQLPRILKVGTPIALGTISYALVYWGMLYTSISPLGPHVNAALGIGFSVLEGFTWPCFHGVELAVASFVGRSLGAGRPDQAKRVIRLALPFSLFLGITASVAFYFGADLLTGFFTEDPMVHEQAILYATVLAFSQIFVAITVLNEGVLAGAGATRTVFILTTPLNVLRVPLAYFLAFTLGYGAAGIWWAINLTTYAKAIATTAACMRGKWAEQEI